MTSKEKNVIVNEQLLNQLYTDRQKLKEQNALMLEALKKYYDHSKNNHQINGLNETAKQIINQVSGEQEE